MTTHDGQYIVRTILSSDKIARGLARLTVKRGHSKIAVLWEEGGFGEDLAYQYRVALDALNATHTEGAADAAPAADAPTAPPAEAQIVYQWSYARERADFRLPVNELKGAGADIIFFAGLEPWAGDFVRMARGVGIKTGIFGAFSDTPEMRARAGPAIDGTMYFDFYDVNSPSPENQAFVRKFRARFKRNPDTWAAQGYDALHILAKAVETTGSANPLDLSYAIRFMDAWEGANGRYKFDERGELEDKRFYINIYRGGVPVTIYECPPAPAPLIR
jgi:branched-chain amino acid transport system substrate-binding protein